MHTLRLLKHAASNHPTPATADQCQQLARMVDEDGRPPARVCGNDNTVPTLSKWRAQRLIEHGLDGVAPYSV